MNYTSPDLIPIPDANSYALVPQLQEMAFAIQTALDSLGVGTGDVVGPASAVNLHIAVFDTTTGKLIKDGGFTIAEIVAGGAAVASVFGRTGAVVAVTNDYTWAQINKSTSSLADITTRSATDLSSGTLQDARFPATLPALSGVNLTSINASALASGTIPAARMPALTGDVTSTVGTISTTIANNVVSLAKMADMATASFLGRNTTATGDPEVLSIATVKTMLGLTGSNTGDVTLAGENYLSIAGQVITANAVNLSGTNVTGTLAAARFPALTGDVTTSAGSLATAIGANKVTLAMMAQVATASVLGRNTVTTGNVEVLTTLPIGIQDNITRLGTIVSGVWNGTVITVLYGGTGAASFTLNGVLYGNSTSALQVTAQGPTNSILTANAGAPSFSASPTIGTSVTTPLVIGGGLTTSVLRLRATSGVGTTGSSVIVQVGNNGAIDAITAINNGNVGIGTSNPLAKLVINGGLHVGGDSDPGDNNALVDGTFAVTGITTLTGILNANGGIAVDTTAFTVANTTGNTNISGYVGHPNYVSQTTTWRVDNLGAADFRYLFTDELHAKSFIADLEQALAGGQIITKSVGVLGADFTAPAGGATATLTMKDLPSAANMAIFESGDYVRIRSFSRAAGSLTIADCWGIVTAYADQAGGLQTWTFTRGSGANIGSMTAGTVVEADAIVLDYGTTGNGFYEVNAIDGLYGINSPYAQVVTWTTSPIAANQTLRTRFGNLRGITAVANEYGLIAGTYAATTGQYFRASNQAFELHGINLLMWDGATNVIKLDRTAPSFALGSPVPTAYGTGTGVWMGKDTAYKFRVGVPGGAGIFWDGTKITWTAANTTLDASGNLTATSATLSGSITATTGAIGGWTIAASNLSSGGITLAAHATPASNKIYVGTGTYGNVNTQFYVDGAGKFSLEDKLTWDGTSLTLVGSITITNPTTAGINYAGAATPGAAATSIVGQAATATSSDFSAITGATKPANNATVGAVWGTNLTGIPATLGTPSGTGLFLAATHMGYYTASTWTTYIDSSGNMLLGNPAGAAGLSWNQGAASLTIKGSITITNPTTAGINYAGAASPGAAATSIVGQAATATSSDFSAVTGATKPANNATVGAAWGTNLTGIPATLGTPSGSGLFLSATNMGYYTGGLWKTYIDSSGNMILGDPAGTAGLSWNQGTSTLLVKGSITIVGTIPNTSVSGLGTLSTLNSVDLATGQVTNKSLANVDSTANTKLGTIATGATVGATWGTNLNSIPATLGTPAGSGLFLSATNMGYYTGGVWTTYIDNAGNMILGDPTGDAGLSWNQSTAVLSIKGAVNAISGAIAGWTISPIINPVNIVGGTFSGNVFTKTATTGIWNAGFSSNSTFSGDGYIEWVATESNTFRIVGLSTTDPDQDINTVQYGIQMRNTATINIWESGVDRGSFGAYVANVTVFRIQRVGTTLTYYKNGVSQRVVAGITTSPLLADAAVFTIAGTVGPITMVGGGGSLESTGIKISAGSSSASIAIAEVMTLDVDGLTILAGTSDVNKIKWASTLSSGYPSPVGWLQHQYVTAGVSQMTLGSDASGGASRGEIILQVGNNLGNGASFIFKAEPSTGTNISHAAFYSLGSQEFWGLSIGRLRTGAAPYPIAMLDVDKSDSTTNAFTDIAAINHRSTGTPATNFGGSILFNLESTTTEDQNAARIGALWTTATHASRASAFVIQTVTAAGALTERLRVGVGLVVGAPTGGDKGVGTINAVAVYDDNVILTDYVFEDDYKLLSIPDMRTFYQEHKHLPTIPGRDEWERKGKFSVGQLSTHFWETLEVQARYIAELEERINHLEGNQCLTN